ncbi:hypothetical protein pYptb0033 (plasmid) [Yersinia pseudotuberculosis IP 32953]|uniref:Uncharacterized protein n=1 Tax=Yersinia pseudotuberculosis serotype I (strain IP32953) TaxID=273123 RepID=Q663C2_YERPS|nr:hypothetical protein pYptb0033 [Yersinia pseudotuberculosis IP 32953]
MEMPANYSINFGQKKLVGNRFFSLPFPQIPPIPPLPFNKYFPHSFPFKFASKK